MDSRKHLQRLILEDVRKHTSTNQMYLSRTVSIGKQRYFYKCCLDQRRLLRIENEWRWINKFSGNISSPQPIMYIPEQDNIGPILVREHVPGESNIRDKPIDTLISNAAFLGEALKNFHCIENQESTITFDGRYYLSWFDFIRQETETYIQDIENLTRNTIKLESMDKVRSYLLEGAAKLSNREICIIHGDPTLFNFILKPNGCFSLVDFELTQAGDPLFDLAVFYQFLPEKNEDIWSNFLYGYGLERSSQTDSLISYYRAFRMLRLCRGKVWIHNDLSAFHSDYNDLLDIVRTN